MSKFNQTATTKVNNYENGINYLNDAKIELSSIVLNATMSGDSFYEKENDKIEIIKTKACCQQKAT